MYNSCGLFTVERIDALSALFKVLVAIPRYIMGMRCCLIVVTNFGSSFEVV